MAKRSTVNDLVHEVLCKSSGIGQKGRGVVTTLPSPPNMGQCVGATLKGLNGGTRGGED